MNDIRRTILWVIFGFSMVLLWDQWQVYNGQKATFFPSPATKQVATNATGAVPPASAGASAVPAPSATATPTVPGTPPIGAAQPAMAVKRERVEISTDVLKLSFDADGATLARAELLRHADAHTKGSNVMLLDESRERVYMAQTGLIGAPAGAEQFPTHKSLMKLVSTERQLKDDASELVVKFESEVQGGVKLVKSFTLKRGEYAIAVKHEIVNVGTAAVTPQLYLQLVRDGNKPEGESSFYSTFTGPAVYTNEKKYQKVEFTDIEKNKIDIEKTGNDGYVAMVQHYFASAWVLGKPGETVARDLFMRKVDNNLYAVGMITSAGSVAPGTTKAVDALFYVGPQEEDKLEALAPGLELVKDYGWLTILAKPLYWLLNKLHSFIGNWGWSIMALVVLIKVAFYWLTAKGYQSMAKMKAINPKIMEMRERLKDKPQEMQPEMMRIYREEKVNPMGGCFPMLVQIPVFIALYWVLLSTVEMRNAPWIGWIHDLAAPDPFYILPVVMTLTTMLQTALNPAPPDPIQAKMMWIMPLAFSVMFFFFPSGLVLYWITNNTLSIAQQWLINTRMGVPPQFNLPKF